jgi:thiol-disulfide isomerase/thioredoxin
MKIDFKRLNDILEAKASRAIDRLDGLKCYTPEFTETLNSILFMLESSKELEVYDTECQDCKKKETNEPDSDMPKNLTGMLYQSFNNEPRNPNRLVLFYSEGCKPCQFLKPILIDYTQQKGIELELVSVDTPEGETHARAHQIEGFPTIFVVNNNVVRHTLYGADMNAPEEMTKQRFDNELVKFFI